MHSDIVATYWKSIILIGDIDKYDNSVTQC